MYRTACAVPSALMLCLAAGTTLGQTYTGGSANDSNWSSITNWAGNIRPAQNGANNLAVTMGNAPANRRATNVDHVGAGVTEYTLNRLIFAANSVNMQLSGVPFRFDGTNPQITNNTDDDVHLIHNDLRLAANLTINGSANRTNAPTQLVLFGAISPVGAGARGVTINMRNAMNEARDCDVVLWGANTFTGGVNLQAGNLVIGNNNALGNGGIFGIAGTGTRVRAAAGGTYSVGNAMAIGADTTFGAAGATGRLRFTGLTNFGTTNAAPVRRIDLQGGRGHVLELAGELQLGAAHTLNIFGDTGPTILAGRIRNRPAVAGQSKAESLGSEIAFTAANVTTLTGAVNVNSASLRVNSIVGAANNRIQANWTIGDGTNPAAMLGRGVILGARNTPGVDPARLFFANNRSVNVRAASCLEPGGSPGLLAINGGGVLMDPGSNFGVTLNGFLPGNGDGFYSQLLLEEGATMTLSANSLGERPVLGVDLQPAPAFPLLDGVSFVIIDQDSSAAPSLYTPDLAGLGGTMFMSPDGNALRDGVYFAHESLPTDRFFQISYFGGDTGNDVVLTIVEVPTPGAASLAALAGLVAVRRKRR